MENSNVIILFCDWELTVYKQHGVEIYKKIILIDILKIKYIIFKKY